MSPCVWCRLCLLGFLPCSGSCQWHWQHLSSRELRRFPEFSSTFCHPTVQKRRRDIFFSAKKKESNLFVEFLGVLHTSAAPTKSSVWRAHRDIHPPFDKGPSKTVFFDNGSLGEPIGLVQYCNLSTLCKSCIGHHFYRTSLCLLDFPGFCIKNHRFFKHRQKIEFCAEIFFPESSTIAERVFYALKINLIP